MANEPYSVSVETKAQLEEIQKLLAELRAINAEISKINGQTFSSVSASAAELSSTGKDLAKALVSQRIASEELNKMLGKTGSSFENAKTKTKDFKDEVGGAKDSITGFYMELGAMGARMATHLPSAVTKTIQAFGEEEMAIQKLSAAIRANGGRVSEVLPIMQQFASDMQRITGFGDEQILSMQGVATSMGVSSGQMQETIRSAIGLSSALGMDLPTSTKAASAAIQGKMELLTRYIPTLSMCKTAEEKLAKVQELSANGFSQAEAASESLIGILKSAANAWGDLQEVVGETFAPTVRAVASLFQGFCEVMTENKKVTKLLTSALVGLAVGFAFSKVGGLVNVAKMFTGIAAATGSASGAMHGLNMAIKANPIGLIASVATTAILALTSLADACGELSEAEKLEEEAQEAERITREKVAIETKTATGVLNEYAESIKREGESADETAARIDALRNEIEALSDRSKWNEGEQVEMAKKLVEKKKELAEVQKLYLERVTATANAEYQFVSNRETERKYSVEQDLNAARQTGIAHIIKFREAELKNVEELQKSVEIQKKYYADHAHLVKTEEDRKRIMADAVNYADESVQKMREEAKEAAEKASTEKWLAAESEKSKTVQRGLEYDILKARASGNEAQAKDIQGKLRIAQLSAEIFENTRKEGMSRTQLQELQNAANAQAQERYGMEKSITDELERQNLAKDAQAKIEDILMANKIEQLKAEGKLTDAKELEREREIKRTLAGMKGVSEADKKKLGNVMRQTNKYKDSQERKSQVRSSGGEISYRNKETGASITSNGQTGSSSRNRGPTPPKGPATVSSKYAGLYDEWKTAGGNKSGQSWEQYRKAASAPNTAQKRQANARNILGGIERGAAIVANRNAPKVGGALKSSADASAKPKTATPPAKPKSPMGDSVANDTGLNEELANRGVGQSAGGKDKKLTDAIDKISKNSDESLKILKEIKNNTAAGATKDNQNA